MPSLHAVPDDPVSVRPDSAKEKAHARPDDHVVSNKCTDLEETYPRPRNAGTRERQEPRLKASRFIRGNAASSPTTRRLAGDLFSLPLTQITSAANQTDMLAFCCV
jgi:hypothetical protein